VEINAMAGDNFINAVEYGDELVISGTATDTDGQTLTVSLNGQDYTSTVTAGTWSVTVDATTMGALADAPYTVTAEVTDTSNNPGETSRLLTIDTVIVTPTVALTNDTGAGNSDSLTNDASLTFSAAAADVTRTFTVDGGAAAATYTAPTSDGSHTVVVTDTDTAGNTTNASVTFTLDTTLATPTLALTNDTGSSNTDKITSDASVTASSTTPDIARTFTVDGGAPGSFTPPSTDGSHTVVVTDIDPAGNSRTASLTFTRDTTAPTLTVSGVDISNDTGASASDFDTNTAAQTITGTLSNPLAAGDTLSGSVDNGANWTDITASVTGTAISWAGATLAAGSDTIAFQVTDAAGNAGATTGSQAYTVDSTPPQFHQRRQRDLPQPGHGHGLYGGGKRCRHG